MLALLSSRHVPVSLPSALPAACCSAGRSASHHVGHPAHHSAGRTIGCPSAHRLALMPVPPLPSQLCKTFRPCLHMEQCEIYANTKMALFCHRSEIYGPSYSTACEAHAFLDKRRNLSQMVDSNAFITMLICYSSKYDGPNSPPSYPSASPPKSMHWDQYN